MTELIAGFAGWNGREIRFQPGDIASLVGRAAVTFQFHFRVWAVAAVGSLKLSFPAMSTALICNSYLPTLGAATGMVNRLLSGLVTSRARSKVVVVKTPAEFHSELSWILELFGIHV